MVRLICRNGRMPGCKEMDCPLAILYDRHYCLILIPENTGALEVKCSAKGLRARKLRTQASRGFLALNLNLLGTSPLLTESCRKLPAARWWVDADRSNMKQMVIDTILLKECSTGILQPVVFSLLTLMPVQKEQEAVRSFELQALHWLDKTYLSPSHALIQRSVYCLILAFVSGLFVEAPVPRGWSVWQPTTPG